MVPSSFKLYSAVTFFKPFSQKKSILAISYHLPKYLFTSKSWMTGKSDLTGFQILYMTAPAATAVSANNDFFLSMIIVYCSFELYKSSVILFIFDYKRIERFVEKGRYKVIKRIYLDGIWSIYACCAIG